MEGSYSMDGRTEKCIQKPETRDHFQGLGVDGRKIGY
jgi:hypothetical protein